MQLAPGIVDKDLEDLICLLGDFLLRRILLIYYRHTYLTTSFMSLCTGVKKDLYRIFCFYI